MNQSSSLSPIDAIPFFSPVYVLLSYIFGGKKDGLNIVVPFIEERMRYKEDTEAKPVSNTRLRIHLADRAGVQAHSG